MSAAGLPFSLGTFSWALKRKYLARMGETDDQNNASYFRAKLGVDKNLANMATWIEKGEFNHVAHTPSP